MTQHGRGSALPQRTLPLLHFLQRFPVAGRSCSISSIITARAAVRGKVQVSLMPSPAVVRTFSVVTKLRGHDLNTDDGSDNNNYAIVDNDESMFEATTTSLLGTAFTRASRTLLLRQSSSDPTATAFGTTTFDSATNFSSASNNLLGNALSRATRTLSTTSRNNTISSSESIVDDNESTDSDTKSGSSASITTVATSSGATGGRGDEGLPYHQNPALSSTALAHSIWRQVLRPNIDCAIDATCGNGYDSVMLAKTLFSGLSGSNNTKSELMCVDIQEEACQTTQAALEAIMDDPILMKQSVQIIHGSHAPTLPRPLSPQAEVGLVCYNLGWLPNSTKACETQMDTTLQSLVDAFGLVRVGGMVSVMTYPKSNPMEDYAVHAMMEAMACISSGKRKRSEDDPLYSMSVDEFLQSLGPDPVRQHDSENDGTNNCHSVRDAVTQAMKDYMATTEVETTSWRVFQHRQMGRVLSPVLLIATRFK